jgi:hypothetical protein
MESLCWDTVIPNLWQFGSRLWQSGRPAWRALAQDTNKNAGTDASVPALSLITARYAGRRLID